jgi:hypothetical protein
MSEDDSGTSRILDFHHPGLTFILVGVPLHTLLRGTDNIECLKMVVGHQEFSTSFTHTVHHAAEDELSPPCLDDVADYFSLAEEEAKF